MLYIDCLSLPDTRDILEFSFQFSNHEEIVGQSITQQHKMKTFELNSSSLVNHQLILIIHVSESCISRLYDSIFCWKLFETCKWFSWMHLICVMGDCILICYWQIDTLSAQLSCFILVGLQLSVLPSAT